MKCYLRKDMQAIDFYWAIINKPTTLFRVNPGKDVPASEGSDRLALVGAH